MATISQIISEVKNYFSNLFINRKKNVAQNQLRFLSQSIILEEARNPEIVRRTLVIVSMGVLVVLLWSAIARVDEIAKATGEVIPQGRVQQIQHFDGGIVKEINTREGDIVRKGQVLIVLDGAGTLEDRNKVKVEQVSLQIQAEKLRAFLNNREPDFSSIPEGNKKQLEEQQDIFKSMIDAKLKELEIINQQVAQKSKELDSLQEKDSTLKQNLALAEDAFVMQQKLFDQGLISKIKFIENQKNLNTLRGELDENTNAIQGAQNSLKEYESRLASAEAGSKDEAYKQLDQIEGQIAANNEILQKFNNRSQRLEIASEVDGIVKNITVTTIGGVIQPGQLLMEVVPIEDKMLVEVKISPKDIGHIEIGQKVNVKVSAFDFARYGAVEGHLIFISPTTFEDQMKQERYYKGRISLEKNYVGREGNIIFPGMTVDAEIVTGRKSVLSYLLKPVQYATSSAFKER